MNIGSIAVSGMNAAAVRLGVAANNLISARSTAPATANGQILGAVYAPQQVAQSTLTTGGVTTTLVPVTPQSFIGPDLNSPTSFSAYPNVDIGAELVNLSVAANSYKAAAQVLSVESQISKALFDIIG
jgi:flagellar basal-body rod protein FlgC